MNPETGAAASEIDAIIAAATDWRGETLSRLRRVILSADSAIVEEIKWRKPSKPEGVATWMLDGNICMADLLKNAVRLTFPHGAEIADPTGSFNTRLDSKTVRAMDVFKDTDLDEAALRGIVAAAIDVNTSRRAG